MKWRTKLQWANDKVNVEHHDNILSLGSCFANHIGEKMKGLKWPIHVNPLGIVYNPYSLFRHLEYLLGLIKPSEHHFIENQGIWHHWDFHSDLSAPSRKECADRIQLALGASQKQLKESRYLFLTLGTAWVYRHHQSGHVVANNHKMPASAFELSLLKSDDIVSKGLEVIKELQRLNPGLEIMISVSPVRHLSHGLVNNNLSKATLLLAAHELEKNRPHVHYFPGFELLIDDLRDYRFYKPDLAHPNEMARDYIWEFFCDHCLTPEATSAVKNIEKYIRRTRHLPYFPDSPEHQSFQQETEKIRQRLQSDYPYGDWR